MEAENKQVTVEVPVTVQVVGWLLILQGLWAALGMFVRFTQHQIHVDVGVLGIFVGAGILFLNPWCRRLAPVLLLIAAVDLVAKGVTFLRADDPLTYDILGIPKGYLPKWAIWPILSWALILLIWEIWVLLRPSIRTCFQKAWAPGVELHFRKQGWTAFWLLVILGVSGGEMWYFSGLARQTHAWRFLHQPPGGEAGFVPVGKTGDREIHWHSTIRRDGEIARSDSREITVIGQHQGKEIARFRARYERTVDTEGAPVTFHMRIFATPDDSEYALRSAVTVKRYDLRMHFAMVAKEFDNSKDVVYLPDSEFQGKFPFGGWNDHKPCPVLMYFVTERGHRGPEGVQVDMMMASQQPGDARPFPGSKQPIAWIVEVSKLDAEGQEVEGSFARYEIAEGAHDEVVKKTARE